MHDLSSMLADLREAIGDMPIAATIIHKGGFQTNLPVCAVSDIVKTDRAYEDEGIMEQGDVSLTYPTADTRKVLTGDMAIIRGVRYRVLRVRSDRSDISTTLECKEEQ